MRHLTPPRRLLQVDFANAVVGGGVLGNGAVQVRRESR
jgi:hypothetical protein